MQIVTVPQFTYNRSRPRLRDWRDTDCIVKYTGGHLQ